MLFTSWDFWGFFLLVAIAWHLTPFSTSKWILLIASYAFYAFFDVRFSLLLAFVTLTNYFLAFAIVNGRRRALWKNIAVASTLLVLGFFKYYDFFVTEVAARFSIDPDAWALRLVLPVGISFYTFRGISYTLDVFRGKMAPAKSLVDFALYIAFFPHLASGPIARASEFLLQLEQRPSMTDEYLSRGVGLILLGVVKKLVFADNLATVANAYFGNIADNPGAIAAWSGAIAYTMQLFFDFSGYTDIALGCGELLGFRFPQNFARPYLSADVQEFWRRWHISLSAWLRDYLYISLGGNRKGRLRTNINLFLTMLLGGLWHGANWTFLVWGGLHGGLLVVDRVIRPKDKHCLPFWRENLFLRIFATLLTFFCICCAWVFFRADTIGGALAILRGMFQFSISGTSLLEPFHWTLIALSFIGMVLQERYGVFEKAIHASVALRTAILVLTVIAIVAFHHSGVQIPFLYFKF